MILRIKKEKVCSILFVACAMMIIFAPYQADSTLSLHSTFLSNTLKILLYFFTGINIYLIIFPIIKNREKILSRNLIQIIPMLIYFFLTSIHTYGNSFNFSGFLFLILWITFSFASDNIKIQTFKYFKWIWVIISLMGIICYLNYMLNLFLPYKVVDYYGGHDNVTIIQNYIDYKFIFLYRSVPVGRTNALIRLCGICNEPGYFGTICALILCACSLNLKDKSNIIILISGCLTVSLGFVITLVVYILLKYLKNVKTVLLTTMITLFYLFVLPNINTGNRTIDNFIQRMVITEDGLTGDNRSNNELDYIFDNSIKVKPLFGYGNGYLKAQNLKGGVSSYKIYVVQYGIIGCIFLWGSLLYASLYKNNVNYLTFIYVFVFFMNIYQRQNVMTLQYQILLFGGILFSNKINSMKLKKSDSVSLVEHNNE